jgi:hypothetical protein
VKLRKTEQKDVNYPSMDKYGNFAKLCGAVAITATLTVGGCAKEKEDSKKPGKIKKGDIVKDPVKPVVKGKVKKVKPGTDMKHPVVGGKIKVVEPVKKPDKTITHLDGEMKKVKPPEKKVEKVIMKKVPKHIRHRLRGRPRKVKPIKPLLK